MHIYLLGGFRVETGGEEIPADRWRLRKSRSLIKLLALSSGYRLHREQAIEWLWPGGLLESSLNSLHQALYDIRRGFDPQGEHPNRYIAFENETIRLCPEGELWVDVVEFEQAAREARQSGNAEKYEQALALYGGELLPEDLYEEWVGGRREALKQEYLSLLQELGDMYAEGGEDKIAVASYQKLIGADPTNEEAHLALIRLYIQGGQRSKAIRQYQVLSETLRRELNLEPGRETRQAYEQILAGEERHAVKAAEMKLPAEPVLRGNLPYALSSFVGREREIAAVVQELASSRLVTLTGTGGTGKTRLAIQVARQLEERFPHKAWLVELAPLTDASLIPQTIAAALRLKQHPGRSLLETLQDYLYDKRLLIVLDNCEHLVAGSAQVADGLLHACPQVRILATSRERLGSEGEVVYSVPPLTLPEDPGQMTLLSISQSEAAQLFVERARAVLPGYTPTAEEAAAIVQICRRLDGLPLALELAAARLSAFDVQQIAARLEENFSTLGAGRWTSFPHQQTLQASIEWSYNLLSEPERILLRRLAVFAGGWTLPAVEAVCADEEDPGCIASIPVIDLLNQLVQKSLVRVERKLGLESRYTMLEIVRKFTTEKLAESDDEEWLSDRHLAYYHWLAEMNDRLLWTDASEPGMALMTVEIDNFRRALGWSVIEPVLVRLMGGLRLLVALRTFWRRAGLNYDEYKFWVDKLLILAPGEGIEWKHLRGKALNSAIWWFTRPQEASRILTESVELLREVDDLPELANALTKLAGIFTMFDLNLASRPVEEAITIYREIGDKSGLGFALSVRSVLALYEYDFDVAAVCARECIELFHQIDYRWEIHEPFSIMAFVHAVRGEELPAREYVKEALKVSMQIEMVTDERILTYGRIGIIYYLLNDFEQMELVLLPIKNQLFGTRNTTTLIWARRSLGIARKRLGKYQEAAADFLASVPDTEFVDDPYGVYAALAGIAGVAVHTGHASVAARLLGKVAEFFEGFTKPLDLIEMREFDFDLATVRAALSEAEFAHAWDAGKALTLEQAKSEAQVFVTQFLR